MDGPSGLHGFQGLQGSNSTGNNKSESSNEDTHTSNGTEKSLLMPTTNVIRVMRKVLPTYAQISEEGMDSIRKSVTRFISFVTGEANEKCQREHRRIINADDLLCAMEDLGFDDYVRSLTLFLKKYREKEVERCGLLPLKRTTSAANLGQLQPRLPLSMTTSSINSDDVIPTQIMDFDHHHGQLGAYGGHPVMEESSFRMSHGGDTKDGGASSSHHHAAFDSY